MPDDINSILGVRSDLPTQNTGTTPPRQFAAIKFGLFVGIVWIVLLVLNLIISNTSFHNSRDFDTIAPITVGGWFLCTALLAIASLVGGIQKGRPGIGVIGMILTPIGFLFVLAAKPKDLPNNEQAKNDSHTPAA